MFFRITCFLILLSQSWVASQAQESEFFGGLGIVMEMSQNGIRVTHVSEAAIAAGSPIVAGDIILGLGEAEQEFDEFKDSDLDDIRFKIVGPLREPIGIHVIRGTERKHFVVNRVPLENATVAALFLRVHLNSMHKDEPVAASALARFKQIQKSISYRNIKQLFQMARHGLIANHDYSKAVYFFDLEEDCYTQRYGENSPEVYELRDARAYFRELYERGDKTLKDRIERLDAELEKAKRSGSLELVEETSAELIAILDPIFADVAPIRLASVKFGRAANLYRLKEYRKSGEECKSIIEFLADKCPQQETVIHVDVYSLMSYQMDLADSDAETKYRLALSSLRMAMNSQNAFKSTDDFDKLLLQSQAASVELVYARRIDNGIEAAIESLETIFQSATNDKTISRIQGEQNRRNLKRLISDTCSVIVSASSDPLQRLHVLSTAIAAISSIDRESLELRLLYNMLGEHCARAEQYDQAAQAFRMSLSFRNEVNDPLGHFLVDVTTNLCSARIALGEKNEGLLRELRVVEGLVKLHGGEATGSPSKVKLLNVTRMIALIASDLGKHDEALLAAKNLLDMRDGDESFGLANDLSLYGHIQSLKGEHFEAKKQYALAHHVMKRLGLGVANQEYSRLTLSALEEEFHFGDRKLALAAFEQLAEEFLERFESASPESTDEEFDSMLAAGKEFMRMRLGMPFRIVPGIQEAAKSPLTWSHDTENEDRLYRLRMYTRLLRFRKVLFDRRIISERGRLARTRLAEFDREVVSLTQKLKSLSVESDERFEVVSKLASIAKTKEEVISTLSKPVAHKGRQIDNPLNFLLDEIGENEILVDFFLVDNAWADVGTRPDNVTEEQWESRLNQELWLTIAAKDFFFIDKLGNFAEIFEQFALFGSMLNETPFESSHPGRKAADMIFVEALLNIESVDYDKADLIFCGEILPFLYPLQALPVPGEDAYLLERVRSVSVFSSPLNYFESKSRKFSNDDKQLLVIEDRSRDLAAGKREAECLRTLELDSQPVFEKVETRFALDGDWSRLATSIGEGTHIVVIGHGKSPLPGEFPADQFEFSNRRRIAPKSNFIGMIGESQAVAVPTITPALLERVDMSDCRLAVFSGCETAIDSVLAYDSPESLQMAALFAGCKASIGTLAEVYDEPSADLVSELFSEMFADKDLELSPRIALARAQKKLIVERRFDSKSLSLAKRDLKEGVPQSIQPDAGKKPDEVLQSKLPPLYWALYVAVDPG